MSRYNVQKSILILLTMFVVAMFYGFPALAQSQTGLQLYQQGNDYFFGGNGKTKDYAKAVLARI